MKNTKYCTVCGNRLVKGELLNYDANSGEPVYDMVCPVDICHRGHEYTIVPYNAAIHGEQKPTPNSVIVCKICGYVGTHNIEIISTTDGGDCGE